MEQIYDSFKENDIKDIMIGLRNSIRSLMNLPLDKEQREQIDICGLINLLEECINRLYKMEKYRKKYKKFKRKYIYLKVLISINDTILRKDVLDAIERWESQQNEDSNYNKYCMNIGELKEIIYDLQKFPKIIKEEKHEN